MTKSSPSRRCGAFTLVELLAAMAVLLLIMAIILQAITATQRATSLSAGTLTAFQEARFANDTLTRQLGQATLNPYWDYYPNRTAPTQYQRASELHFCCGLTTNSFFSSLFTSGDSFPDDCLFFEAPLGVTQSYAGLENVLNACGYFVDFGSDGGDLPSFLTGFVTPHYRFRLKAWQPSSENFGLYAKTSGNPGYDASDWINLTAPGAVRTLAENVVALIVLPKLSVQQDPTGTQLSPAYFYDSRTAVTTSAQRNQLPPLVQVIMVAIDEPSAVKLAAKYGTAMPNLFPTSPALFTNSANLAADLTTLEAILSASAGNATGNTIPLHYVVMNSDVSIHASKWSAF